MELCQLPLKLPEQLLCLPQLLLTPGQFMLHGAYLLQQD